MRALLVAYYWPPSGGPGVQRGLKLARHLAASGTEVTVVTVRPETYSRPGEYAADPSLAADVPEGLRVVRTDAGGNPGLDRFLQRARLFRAAMRLAPGRTFERQAGWLGPLTETLRDLVRRERPDVLFTTSQPYTVHLAALAVRRATGIPWVADFRDPWTQSWGRTWTSEALFRWEERREEEVLAEADAIVWNTPGARRDLLARRPWLDPAKVVVVPNGYDPEDFPAEVPPADPETFTIVHSGAFRAKAPPPGASVEDVGPAGTGPATRSTGRSTTRSTARHGLLDALRPRDFCPIPYDLSTHGPETLFRAVRALGGRAHGRRIRVRLVGSVDAGWKARAANLGIAHHVETPGYAPHRDAVRDVLRADLLFLPTITRTDGGPVANVPAKTYEYLGSGRPLAALAEGGDVADLLAGRPRCVVLPPRDADALAALLAASAAGEGPPATSPDPADAHPWRRREVARRIGDLLAQVSG